MFKFASASEDSGTSQWLRGLPWQPPLWECTSDAACFVRVVGESVNVDHAGERRAHYGVRRFWHTKDPGQQPFTYDAGVGKVRSARARARGVGATPSPEVLNCLRKQ